MNNQRILIATSEFPPQPGGIGNHAYNLALQLSRNGYDVTVIADQRSKNDSQEELFDASLPFYVHRIAISAPRFFMYLRRIIVLFNALSDTHHVIATGKFSLWSVAFSSLFYKRNYLAVIHGSEVNFKGFIRRKSIESSLKRFTSIVAVSNFTKQLINHLGLDVIVIPNGYNPEKWHNSPIETIDLKGVPKLMTVGNVTSRKGQQNVIRMLPKLIQHFPTIHYHCIGLPTETVIFTELAQQLNVASHVSFHGRIEDSTLKSMLLQTDIFIMLSNETATGDVEGFGIAILEANALGVPAIGSEKCGIEDAIDLGNSGILVNPNNSEEVIVAIQSILNTKETFESGAKIWAKKHQWSDIIAHYLKHIK